MEIAWLGHSCFRIRGRASGRSSGPETAIVTDPCPPDSGYNINKPTASIITISHPHDNHSFVKGVPGSPRIIDSPGEYEMDGIFFTAMPTYHDNDNGSKLGKNLVFLMEIEDVSLCHLGDIGHKITSTQADYLSDTDILFIPVGGNSTINGNQASEIVRAIEPKLIIPMHYKTPDAKDDLDTLDTFLKEIGQKPTETQAKLSISRNSLPEEPQIISLDYKR